MRPVALTLGGSHRSPHVERSCSQHAVMHRPNSMPTPSEKILKGTVDVQKSLSQIR